MWGQAAYWPAWLRRLSRRKSEPLALGLAAWYKQLAPADPPPVVFRDSAFADDATKRHLAAILRHNGIENVQWL